jgi:hypothetical protein
VLGRDRGGKKTLTDLGAAAENASGEVAGLNSNVGATGDKAREAQHGVKTLDTEIQRTERSIKDLAEQIRRSPDELPLFRQLSKDQGHLRKLLKIKDILPDEEDGKSSGKRTIKGLASEMISGAGNVGMKMATGMASAIDSVLGSSLSALPPPVQAGIVAGIVAAVAAGAALIGAAVSGAILAGVGGGVLAGGILLAARDPQIRQAGSELGQHMMEGLSAASGVLVRPILDAIQIIRAGWNDILPGIKKAFATVAPYIDDLASGFVGFARNIMPGFSRAIEESGPILTMIAGELQDLGSAFSSFFSDLASQSGGARDGLKTIFDMVELTIVVTGKLLANLAQTFEAGILLSQALRGDIAGMADTFVRNSDAAKQTAASTDDAAAMVGILADKAQTATENVVSLSEALDKLTQNNLDARAAQRDLEAAIDDATAAVKANGAALDEHSAKGRANQAALDAVATATNRSTAATLAQTGSLQATNEVVARGRDRFIELAQKMGLSKDAAQRLADQLIRIPSKDVTITVQTKQALSAIARVQQDLRYVNSKDIHIGVWYDVHGNLKLPGGTQIKGAASGGPVTGGGPKGRDSVLRLLAPGEHVLDAGDVDAMGGQQAVMQWRRGLHRGGPTAVSHWVAAPASAATTARATQAATVVVHEHRVIIDGTGVLEGLRREVHIRGGNVQTAIGTGTS